MMVTSTGPSLPVVHIRVLCERESKGFPCDFCFKTFASEGLLSQHVHADHKYVDVQDVYVCSVCRCCLLCQHDLFEHTAMRHQLQVTGDINKDCMVCEYCGVVLCNQDSLRDHMEMDHTSELLERGYSSYNVVELTLSDISNIGMGDQKCRTLFKVIEIPCDEKSSYRRLQNESLHSDNSCRVEFDTLERAKENKKCSVTKKCKTQAKCSKNISMSTSTVDNDFRTAGNVTKGKSLEFAHEKEKSEIRILPDTEKDEHENGEIAMTIKCEADELSSSSMKGELILTVESDENVIWSKDIMSKVISSSGILGRTNSCIGDQNVIVEKVSEGSFDPDRPDVVSMKVDGEEVEEVVVQLYSNSDNDQSTNEPGQSVANEPRDILDTYVVVNHVDEGGKGLSDKNDTEGQKRMQRRKECCMCGKIFSNLEMLEKHEGSVHGVRIKCDLCSDTFAFSKSLRTHYLRKHDDTRRFPCEICGKMFKSRSNLWSHHLSHDERARQFKCPQCPQRFHSKSKLSCHLQTHSGKKKYQCGECNKGFLYPSLLVKHMGKHFSEERWDLPENESFYLVEVETEDTDSTIASASQQSR